MPIRLMCVCGREIVLLNDHAGRLVKCPECGAVLRIPTAEEDLQLTRFYCACGLRLKARARSAGRTVTCPHCGKKTTVPLLDKDESLLPENFILNEDSGIVEFPSEMTGILELPDEGAVAPVSAGPAKAPQEQRPALEREPPVEFLPLADGDKETTLGGSRPEEEEVFALESGETEEASDDTYQTADTPPLAVSSSQAGAGGIPVARPVARPSGFVEPRRVYVEEGSDGAEEEGLSARELSRYFNAESGVDAARSGVTEVLNGHWLFIPYALLGGCVTLLVEMGKSGLKGRVAVQVGLSVVGLLLSIFLMGGFLGCIKDGIFGRAMGLGRMIRHSAAHFLRLAGTSLLMVPIGVGLGIAGMMLMTVVIAMAPGVLLKILLGLVFLVAGLFFLEVMFVPLAVAVLEKTNPIYAIGRGLKFAVVNLGALFSMTLVALFTGGGLVAVLLFLWWMSTLLLSIILPLWLFRGLALFMSGLASAMVLGLIVSSLMILYLSRLPEERLQKIHGRLRGRAPAAWRLYAAIGVLACAMIGLSYHSFRGVRHPWRSSEPAVEEAESRGGLRPRMHPRRR